MQTGKAGLLYILSKVVALKKEMRERLRIWEEARAESEADEAASGESEKTRSKSNARRTTRPSTSRTRKYTNTSRAETTQDQEQTRHSYDPLGQDEAPHPSPYSYVLKEEIEDMRKRQAQEPDRMARAYKSYKLYAELVGHPIDEIEKVMALGPARDAPHLSTGPCSVSDLFLKG